MVACLMERFMFYVNLVIWSNIYVNTHDIDSLDG